MCFCARPLTTTGCDAVNDPIATPRSDRCAPPSRHPRTASAGQAKRTRFTREARLARLEPAGRCSLWRPHCCRCTLLAAPHSSAQRNESTASRVRAHAAHIAVELASPCGHCPGMPLAATLCCAFYSRRACRPRRGYSLEQHPAPSSHMCVSWPQQTATPAHCFHAHSLCPAVQTGQVDPQQIGHTCPPGRAPLPVLTPGKQHPSVYTRDTHMVRVVRHACLCTRVCVCGDAIPASTPQPARCSPRVIPRMARATPPLPAARPQRCCRPPRSMWTQ